MKSTTILAALFGASVSVSAGVIPRTDPDCEKENGTPTSPIGGAAPAPYGSSKGSGTYGVYAPIVPIGTGTPVSPVVPIGTGTYGKPPTPVSPVTPIGTGTYGKPPSTPVSPVTPIGTGTYGKPPSTPVSPVTPIGTGTYGPPVGYGVGKAPYPKPAGYADGKAPYAKPAGYADGKAPYAKPAGYADGKAPYAKPAGYADGKAPYAKPAGYADGKAPYAKPAGYADANAPYGSGSGSSPGVQTPSTGSSAPPSPNGPNSSSSAGQPTKSPLICGATSLTNHTVASGDTLTIIAKNYTSGICDIASLNKITNPNLIVLGQTLQIPVGCTHPDNTTCLPPRTPGASETCVPGVGSPYTVASGDTLANIAKDFNITLASVIAANSQIKNPDAIQVGQAIKIPICPNSQCDIVGTYTIKSGDLFVDLATRFKTRIGQIKALNPSVDPTKTQPGDVIILPQNCHNVTSTAA